MTTHRWVKNSQGEYVAEALGHPKLEPAAKPEAEISQFAEAMTEKVKGKLTSPSEIERLLRDHSEDLIRDIDDDVIRNKESARSLCKCDSGELYLTQRLKGAEKLTFFPNCRGTCKTVSRIHTHPRQDFPTLSLQDINGAISMALKQNINEQLECISVKKGIECWEINPEKIQAEEFIYDWDDFAKFVKPAFRITRASLEGDRRLK